MRLELVTRKGCHLCDEAKQALRSLGLEANLVDLDSRPDLADLYDFRVPVVLVDGRVVAEGRVDPERLAAVLGL